MQSATLNLPDVADCFFPVKRMKPLQFQFVLWWVAFQSLFQLTSCRQFSSPHTRSSDLEKTNQHAAYDDSTLQSITLPVLMPYNRIINPAGETIVYGDEALENHTLDLKSISGTDFTVIEDRYGIAMLNHQTKKIVARWSFGSSGFKDFMSTYSGIEVLKEGTHTRLFWSAARNNKPRQSAVFEIHWNGKALTFKDTIQFQPTPDAPLALPNEVAVQQENGRSYLYVVLNGNNQLAKIDLATKKPIWTVATGAAPYGLTLLGNKAFVSNWGGDLPSGNSTQETAGIPYGKIPIDPKTGASEKGSVHVFSTQNGQLIQTIATGLHPNDIISSLDGKYVFVANGNSDNVTVIDAQSMTVSETISVKIDPGATGFIGDTPNALALSPDGTQLYVANGMDNAVAVVQLGAQASASGTGPSRMQGFIPTEAYPGGLTIVNDLLLVTNLEGEGARINSQQIKNADKEVARFPAGAYNSHHQKATLSVIPLPDSPKLQAYTATVKSLMLYFRTELARLSPRPNQPPRPMPERIGEPSVFTHVLYIIKENRTYDQVLGDLPQGNGAKELCLYGDSITPNQHKLARDYLLLDNYYASGKCSAEGHQWTDAAMVTDYVEKNVRAWFRSYPHVQNDALVYSQKGFIWNNAADHGKTVRIYGEACMPEMDEKLTWTDIYTQYKAGKPLTFHNESTISRVRPWLSPIFPGSDELKITDQLRADAFIKELNAYEKQPGDALPNLMVMALSTDHTVGLRPGMPTPNAMIADNDLALGRIIEAVTKSRFWKNTVIFVTEDDSQAGWDHVSAYRTTGFVVSPYSKLKRTISVNYNQTSMVRSIEQILGIPPMNLLDATALPMFECFEKSPSLQPFASLPSRIPLNQMNKGLSLLEGKALYFARQSMRPEYDHIDNGNDAMLNRILWFAGKKNRPYPAHLAGTDEEEEDDDDDD